MTRDAMIEALRERVAHLEYHRGSGPIGKRLHELDCMRAALHELEADGWRAISSIDTSDEYWWLIGEFEGKSVVFRDRTRIWMHTPRHDGDAYTAEWLFVLPAPPGTSDGG